MSLKPSNKRNLERRIAGVTMPISRKRTKWCRNWPCLCGSGKKYKKCCLRDIDALTAVDGDAKVEELPPEIKDIVEEIQAKLKEGGLKSNG